MDILRAGAEMMRAAERRLDVAAERLVTRPVDPSDLINVSIAEDEAQIGAKLVEAGKKMTGALLDVLA
ncbi:MAG: hypothetical protein HY812_14865 [Planctomycetes bacterium]|nr:hypothetical protein [Planctomycetota bacterium]